MILVPEHVVFGDKTVAPEKVSVRVTDGRISAIMPEAELIKKFPEEEVRRYPGMTLLPGMIDLHVHLGCAKSPAYHGKYNSGALRALYTAYNMKRTLEVGVTTIRDSGSTDGLGTAVKQAARDGYIQAPRLFATLQGLCMTGGHGADTLGGQGVIEVDSVDECVKAVRLNAKRGADCIKILTSEGYRGEELTQEEITAITKETHRLGKKVAVHAGYGASLEYSINAGVDSIEHGTNLTVEQGRRMAEKGITWVPTAFVFHFALEQMKNRIADLTGMNEKDDARGYLEDAVEAYKANLRSIYDTGVRVCTGTDTDITTWKGASPVAEECEMLVKLGLTPLEAIECATKNGADYLGMGASLGQVREGYIADLILVEGNPAEDICALKRVKTVFQNGKPVCEG